MARVIADELAVCTDCAMMAANGEGTEEHAAAMMAVWGPDTMGLVITCLTQACEDFSTRRCDGCGSELAGERHSAAVLANDLPMPGHWSGCPADCSSSNCQTL